MKKLNLLLSLFMFVFVSFASQAQTTKSSDYFVGRWNVLVKGTPSGDAPFLIDLKRVEGKLTGNILNPETKEVATPLNKIEEDANYVNLFFVGGGYDCYLFLEKKDENNVAGSLMDMFDATGKRIIEEKQTQQN